MKLKFLFLLAAVSAFIILSACNDDDDHYNPDKAVKEAFETKYPAATRVEWEKKGKYQVADFRDNNKEMSAWFDADGNWYMTETDLTGIEELPEAVKTAFRKSEYAQWKVEDIDMLERKDSETIYIIEVENGKQDIDLYYSADGILIKSVADKDANDDQDYLPGNLPAAVETFIHQRYPNARIVEFETDKGNLEVDIIHDNRSKEVVFNSENTWLYTEFDVKENEVPQNVKNALAASEYSNYQIDDIDFFEMPDTSFYRFELESGNKEVKLDIDVNGVIK